MSHNYENHYQLLPNYIEISGNKKTTIFPEYSRLRWVIWKWPFCRQNKV